MNLLKKAAISLAATSMLAAPVAASAAPAMSAVSFDDVNAVSAVEGQSELEGSTSWIIALLALIAIIGGIVIAAGNNSDDPTSP
ncbi:MULTISPECIES: hypothetical protein [unclassified Sphingopyxis]|uniref:hypothetical protein n=1 Tax=unclassified Sphingopyxis TaxID=2614943 RepID=UPI000735E529|nr:MULTISPECIES: hypothetical protein [unclassified Sphingopyxis]KTE32068.1 hypothetical protein ATE62_18505 [Sphingopyxis sp. HIX]KTE32069.1 hypothetical protein ATE62_18530 [Sphingopyxis sp. HIX]KTE86158.1 hypothetical protein ATE72_00710 [Sphingopyxis sp. HXXIV]